MADLSFIVKAIDQASGTLNDISGRIGNMEGKSSRLGGVLKGGLMVGAGAAAAGIGALAALTVSSISAASEMEGIQAQLGAVLKSTGGAAGVSAEEINAHAEALEKTTRFTAEQTVSAQSLLLTFTKVGKDTFPQATESILDMSQAMGMDLQSATVMVGKALNDPILGITAMSRAGIQFSQAQKDTIKTMVEMGDVAGAQAMILAELEVQFGGSAKAAGDTLAGQMEILKNGIGAVTDEIGFALIPVLRGLATWIGPRLVSGFQRLTTTIVTTVTGVQRFFTAIGTGMREGWDFRDFLAEIVREFPNMPAILQDAAAGVASFVSAFTLEDGNFFEKLKAGFEAVDWETIGGTIKKGLETLGGNIKTAIDGIDWSSIGPAMKKAWDTIATWWETDAAPFATEVAGNMSAWWSGTFLPALAAIDWASIGASMQSAWDTLSTWWEEEALPLAVQVAQSISTWFTGQVIPQLQTHAPLWGAELTKVLKSAITISGFQLGEDANLAYTLGAGYIKLMTESLKALSIGPRLVFDALKKAFEGGLGGANVGAIFGDIFGPIGDFLKGALDAMLISITGDMTASISAWWNSLWASITGFFGGGGGGGGTPHGSMYAPPPVPPSSSSSSVIADRSANGAGGYAFNITINAPGGNPQAVAAAAQTGVLAAARSMGLA